MDTARKIRLNDAQWNRLQKLAGDGGERESDEATGISHRLVSNGLVASGPDGAEYLTEQGMHRLSQGR